MKTLALLAFFAAFAPAEGKLDIETLLDIRHPSGAVWSPDGSRIAFLWDRAGAQNLYVVARVSGWPEPLTDYPSGLMSEPFWSPDGKALYFEREGELWSVEARGRGAPRKRFSERSRPRRKLDRPPTGPRSRSCGSETSG